MSSDRVRDGGYVHKRYFERIEEQAKDIDAAAEDGLEALANKNDHEVRVLLHQIRALAAKCAQMALEAQLKRKPNERRENI